MREIVSSSSLKAIYLNSDKVIAEITRLSSNAFAEFSELQEIRVFGSVARNEAWGLSDVDLLLIVQGGQNDDPLDRIRPFYAFFSKNLDLAVDILVVDEEKKDQYQDFLENSVSLARRGSV